MKKVILYSIAGIVFIMLVISIIIYLSRSGMLGFCPYQVLGNPNATTQVLYFEKLRCKECDQQRAVNKQVLAIAGKIVRFEVYNLNACSAKAESEKVITAPTYVFKNNIINVITTDKMNAEQLLGGFCTVSGKCTQ